MISAEIKAVLTDLTDLKNKAMELDRSVERVLLPKAREMADRGDLAGIQQIISEMPECITRMKLAGLLASKTQ